MAARKPSKISVRPANELESPEGGIVVWVYGRKVQVQLVFENFDLVENCISDAVTDWHFAMEQLEGDR